MPKNLRGYKKIIDDIKDALENGDIQKLKDELNKFFSKQTNLKSINPHSFAEEASYRSVISMLFHFAFMKTKSIHIETERTLENTNRPDLVLYNTDHPDQHPAYIFEFKHINQDHPEQVPNSLQEALEQIDKRDYETYFKNTLPTIKRGKGIYKVACVGCALEVSLKFTKGQDGSKSAPATYLSEHKKKAQGGN